MTILGISGFYHDSAAALVRDGEVIAAAQEERFNRQKHFAGFPHFSVRYCLEAAKIKAKDIDFVAFYDKPFLKFERLLETYLAFAPKGFKSFKEVMPIWIKDKLFQKKAIIGHLKETYPELDWDRKLLFIEHHLSHAASAFYPSPFSEAAVLTMDGVGEWATTSIGIGKDADLNITKEIHFPHSLGLLYSAFTYYLGFKVNSGEYKLMGLAPYGRPIYRNLILDNLLDLKGDGTFRLDQSYFDYCTGLKMTNNRFEALFGGRPRSATDPILERHMNLAASIQAVTEEIVLRLTRHVAAETSEENLCLAGGVALNCVANGKVLKDSKFKKIWVQPAAGDAGGALGAALAAHHIHCSNPRNFSSLTKYLDNMKGAYLGPEYSAEQIESALQGLGAVYEKVSYSEMIGLTVDLLTKDNVIGWFQGRMEFGPRALGARSILADARSKDMQKNLNLKVKFRESFRPFAPSVLDSEVGHWFDMEVASPYMSMVAGVKADKLLAANVDYDQWDGVERINYVRSQIPAVTHVDNSARIQTVHRETNPIYHDLISAFHQRTGCPILVNTSFNVRGEPIVCTPADAFRCFMGTNIDTMVIGNFILHKNHQNSDIIRNYCDEFESD